jgi:putative sterol carrier protein
MMTVEQMFAGIQKKLDASPGQVPDLNAVYQFNLTGPEEAVYHIAFTDGTGVVGQGPSHAADLTVTMSAEDFEKMITGKLNAFTAFMSGQIKLQGDKMLAMKIQAFMK